MTRREDLPADPVAAYRALDARIRELRSKEQRLLLLRGKILRDEIAGPERGGKTRAAAQLGVSDVQVGRLLEEDLLRRVRRALAGAGCGRDDYRTRVAGGDVMLSIPDDHTYPAEDEEWREGDPQDEDDQRVARRSARIGRMNAAGVMIEALHAAGLDVDAGEDDPREALASLDEKEVAISVA